MTDIDAAYPASQPYPILYLIFITLITRITQSFSLFNPSTSSLVDRYSCPECRRRFARKPALEADQRESPHAHRRNRDILPTRRLHTLDMQSYAPMLAMMPYSATQFRCCDCERDFKTENALADHIRFSKVHKPGKKKKENKKKQTQGEDNPQTKCKKCKKTFKSPGALGQHLVSVRHKPLSNIKCVADAGCNKRFNCPSAQLHHLESGRCVSGMTKAKLNAAIAARDTEQIITSGGVTAQWLLEDNQSATSTSQIGSPILLTPTSTEFLDSYPSSAILTPTSTFSTSTDFHSMLTLQPRARGGSQTCPLCPPSRTRRFKPSALQQHLSSRVHAQVSMPWPLPAPDGISFHCPRGLLGENSSMKKAVKQFSTVSGLAQHLESGACNEGNVTFRRVVAYVQEEMKSMGLGGLSLLN